MSAHPTFASGKICYIEIPATDITTSAGFYERAFGRKLRRHDDGSVAFDDAVNEVSGTWVLGRKPASEPGLIVSIMVADGAAAVEEIVAAGGEIVAPIDPDAHEVTAWFRDPGGNVLGIYQGRELGTDS